MTEHVERPWLVWCGWAVMTAEAFEAEVAHPHPGYLPHQRDKYREMLGTRYVLHDSGYYVLKHDGGAPYDFDAALAYSAEVAAQLWAFCERHAWQVELVNDAEDTPWFDEGGWVCVASRCAEVKVPYRLGWERNHA